jgi:hypothetical protein
MKTIIKALLLITLAAGCVTAPRQTQSLPTDQTFNATKNAVWPLLVSAVGLDYPVKAVEKESGLLTTDFVSISSGYNNMNMGRWVFPPGGFLATWDGLRMSMSVLVTEPEPGKTHVVIRTHYEAFENNVSHSWIVCQSNGSVEHEILARIAEQLAKAQ